jgi:hypothetical protein
MHYLHLMFHGVEAIRPGFNTASRISQPLAILAIISVNRGWHGGCIRTVRAARPCNGEKD